MANIFSPQEILRIATKVEENGKVLYGNLEKKTNDKALQQTWKYLKEQEELHRATFQKMLDNIGDYVVNEFSPGEYNAYVTAIASEYVFTQGLITEKIKKGFSGDLEAVEFGIYIEKESIITYSALRDYIMTEKQAVLDNVIAEERKHLVNLTSIKSTLKRKG
ncbi:MAG: ferritin family protein [Candidatus Omnitrophica bacterium]|nr:ferritin family protein [Candidatus Omnitrophota bacterium]